MTDILTRNSDGRVQTSGDSIALSSDKYLVTVHGAIQTWPLNAFGFATSLVQNVSGMPADLVGGYNYNYVAGAFVPSGQSPPAPPPPDIWKNKIPLPTNRFIALATSVLTPTGWTRIKTDSHAVYVADMIMTSTVIDPNDVDGSFRAALTYLTTTNGDDGNKLMTTMQAAAINAQWQEK